MKNKLAFRNMFKMVSLVVSLTMIYSVFSIGAVFAQSLDTNQAEADKLMLKWKFQPGHELDVELISTTTFLNEQGNQLDKMKQITNYRWKVESLNQDGTANITVKFNRVRFSGDLIGFKYDSDKDSKRTSSYWGKRLYLQRALLHTQMKLQVSDYGGVEKLLGADSIAGPMMYTPGDWPPLPKVPVQVGDTWTVSTGSGNDEFQQRGNASYALKKIEKLDDKLVCEIEGRHSSQIEIEGYDRSSITSKSSFDVNTGRFIEETLENRTEFENNMGKRVTVQSLVTRRISPVEETTVEPDKPGEYLFYFESGKTHPLMIAGEKVKVDDSYKVVTKTIHFLFFRDWTDLDKDGLAGFDELKDVTSQFLKEDRVRFVVYAVGLAADKLELQVIGSEGVVNRNNIPIKSMKAYAIRELKGLPPGMYFVEFFVNDKMIVCVPVQIVGDDVRSSGAVSIEK